MTDEWPPRATERVEIREWTSAWGQLAAELIADLEGRLDRRLTGGGK